MNSPGKVVNMVHFGQAFVQVMNNTGIDALVAARDHDVDALPQAGNVLYPPYEACDIEDNPGVAKP